jgi:hypothetical protein
MWQRLTIPDARKLARCLMNQNGLNGWICEFSNGRSLGSPDSNAGKAVCILPMKMIIVARCGARRPLSEVQDTLLHEIAHALTGTESHPPAWSDRFKQLRARYPKPPIVLYRRIPRPTSRFPDR